MIRVATLTICYLRCLFRSLAGMVPPGLALAFGYIAFEYGMDQSQFIVVGGIGVGLICLVTTLLLTGQANRAWSYPMVARLRHREELLVALMVGAILLTAILAALITTANLLIDRLTLSFPSVCWVVPTWVAIWFLAATLGLMLSNLVSRRGFPLVAWVGLTGVLVANEQKMVLESAGYVWLARVISMVTWPVRTLLFQASVLNHDRTYWLAFGLTLGYGLLLFLISAILFARKDLLWAE